jgi:protein-S-isoprenylcysteine O-methyltransferase Ste14
VRLIRHLLAILALPFVVAVVVPTWLARRNGTVLMLGEGLGARSLQVAGGCAILVGLVLFATSLRRFASDGEGTLAPWDPPRGLVVAGPYRYVRNPMISGVVFLLAGEAMILLSRPHAVWALTFLAINAIYIPLLEEPQLQHRFGGDYVEYRRHVPRLVPRLRPWTPQRD